MTERTNFRAIPVNPSGEEHDPNERRFRASVESAFGITDDTITLVGNILNGTTPVPGTGLTSRSYLVTVGAGDGSPAGDINETDFSGQQGAVGTCAACEPQTQTSFYHNGTQYLYNGPTPAFYGVGCADTMDPNFLIATGVGTFLALQDTPTDYVGSAKAFVIVNDAEDALQYTADALDDSHEYARKNNGWTRNGVENHDAAADYLKDDLVAYEGTIYFAIQDHPAQAFSLTNWSPISSLVGSGVSANYRWSNTITGDPGSGFFAITDPIANPTNTIRVSDITDQGNDFSTFWENIQDGDFILFIEDTGGAESGIWVASGSAIDNGTYWNIPVTWVNNTGEPENNRKGIVSIVYSPFNRLPAGGNTNDALFKASDGNYDTEWRPIVETDISDLRLYALWKNVWQAQTYGPQEMVRDGDWLMIANKQTSDRAAPQLAGDPVYDLPDTPAWTAQQFSGVVRSGREYDVVTSVQISAYDVWIPTLTSDTSYVILLYSYPTGFPEQATFQQVPEPILLENQWTTVARTNTIITAGTTFGIIIDALNSGSDTTVTGGWARAANSNDAVADPGAGNWGGQNADTLLRINYTDLDATDRTTEIQGIVAGSTIQFVDTTEPNLSITFRALSDPTDQTTHASWAVEVQDTGAAGRPAVGAVTTMTATVPVPSPTDYVELIGGNPAANTRGFLSLDGVDQGADANAYGVRVQYDEYITSPDWDLMGYVGIGGSGSGGGDTGGGGASVFVGELPPTDPSQGDMWYSTGQFVGLFLWYEDTDSAQWVQTNGGGGSGEGGATVEVGDTPPADPEQGDMWFATGETVGLFVWYEDVDSAQWVMTNGGGGEGGGGASVTTGDTFPVDPGEGDLHYKTKDPTGLYVYYNDGDSSQWVMTNGGVLDPEPVTIVDDGFDYQIIGDFLFQWGTETGDAAGVTTTFPIAYASTPTVIGSSSSSTNNRTVNIATPTTTSFFTQVYVAESGATSAVGFRWMAMGEAPDDLKLPKEVGVTTVTEAGGGASVTTGDTFPVSPAAGDLHYLTVEPVGLMVYYTDVDSSQWVQANGGNSAEGDPVTIVEADTNAGWQVWGDVLVQWGRSGGITGTRTVTFAQPFKTAPQVASSVDNNTEQAGTTGFSTSLYNITTTSFGCKCNFMANGGNVGESGASITWTAIGEAPDDLKQPKTVQSVGGAELQEYHDPTGVASWRIVGNTLECWGSVNDPSNGVNTVTMPKTFARSPQVKLTYTNGVGDGTAGQHAEVVGGTKTITQFGVQCYFHSVSSGGHGVAGAVFDWHAIGEWDGVS